MAGAKKNSDAMEIIALAGNRFWWEKVVHHDIGRSFVTVELFKFMSIIQSFILCAMCLRGTIVQFRKSHRKFIAYF